MSTPKKRPAKRKAPRTAAEEAEEATAATAAAAAPHCARLNKCPAGSCHYPQPCNHQTLQFNPSP
ncbi:hypothetical protein GCM10011495_06610 [Hymenobacter frigidus]|uniref:Uncharacterized protein n=1 Tax=Hymenobacter frigidus TaxID=1524095 RepID=A0ABQ1ZW36_9BACT|nr:hypothetical protein [Hymenobacter frigidus]GGH80819.1 hypothetical protein GCM10011495_06610 [Hymenobacter frigidus]